MEVDESELPLMERIRRAKEKATPAPTQQHYPMKSVMDDMDPHEK